MQHAPLPTVPKPMREIRIEVTRSGGVLTLTLQSAKHARVERIDLDRLGGDEPYILKYTAPPAGECEFCGV